MTNYLTIALIAQCVLLFACSVWDGDKGKACYWLGAVILTCGVYFMEG